jgi:hypothetical protein
MHPPLFAPHPLCETEVSSLVKCHEERYIAKFWGVCNDAKTALDMCFRVRRRARSVRVRVRATRLYASD